LRVVSISLQGPRPRLERCRPQGRRAQETPGARDAGRKRRRAQETPGARDAGRKRN